MESAANLAASGWHCRVNLATERYEDCGFVLSRCAHWTFPSPVCVISSAPGGPERVLLLRILFPVLWIVILIYWQIKAVGTKTTERREPVASRILRACRQRDYDFFTSDQFRQILAQQQIRLITWWELARTAPPKYP